MIGLFLGKLFYDKEESIVNNTPNYSENSNNNITNKENEEELDNNIENSTVETKTTDNEEIKPDYLGTYYNEDESDLYFTLKENGVATIVESTCSVGPTTTFDVTYKVSKVGENVLLVFDDTTKTIMSPVMIGSINATGNYNFTVTVPTCVENPSETHYIKK